MEFTLRSIGVARNESADHFGGWSESLTDIVLDPEYAPGLDGLSDYSHALVVYFMHEAGACELRHVPQGKVGQVPEVGIFACRCAQRPNPIGISVGRIVKIRDNTITLKGLDLIHDTPVLDIKPYTPQYDRASDVKTPEWVSKLEY